MTNINPKPIFPDYNITPLHDGTTAYITFLRKKHRGKWYEQNIIYYYYGEDINELAMKHFIGAVYNNIILSKVDPKQTPFTLSNDQRSEEERLTKLIMT